ncbi:MAG TPA: hypothetical protein VMA98_13680 [Candidatus Acidoferrales bacterium]|nr:hypothetical protein [Candidatus Acidoferrales bacterium]
MQRASLPGEIFGYIVCLIAVAVFFMSIAGIVNNAFAVVNPTAGPRIIATRALSVPGGKGPFFFRAFGRRDRGGPQAVTPPPEQLAGIAGNARFDAAKRLVLAIVMLIVSVLVFRRTFAWLNPAGTG